MTPTDYLSEQHSPEQAAHTLGLGLQPLTLGISSQESSRQTEQHASGNRQLQPMDNCCRHSDFEIGALPGEQNGPGTGRTPRTTRGSEAKTMHNRRVPSYTFRSAPMAKALLPSMLLLWYNLALIKVYRKCCVRLGEFPCAIGSRPSGWK